MQFIDFIEKCVIWMNLNQGLLSLILFLITMIFGWLSGIFSALRRKPKFKILSLPGPTYCCTYPTGSKHGEYDVHQTGIAIYLCIANIGSAPSSIHQIKIAYHWDIDPWSVQWLKYTIGWFWLEHQAVALTDFQVNIGEHIKVYPFLTQKNNLSPVTSSSFLEVGQSTNGVVYFEQRESWGGCFPKVKNKLVHLKIVVLDVFGGCHVQKIKVPSVTLAEARKYNPEFGTTLSALKAGLENE